ncbi:MAG: DoxX family protein [Bacteroidales bacterium]|jgi:triosephosphate isomerase|nr:DoxX family protein [Bacteroidales bacterium]
MRFLRAISRVVIGLTFLLSGFVKIIDPVGGGLIIEEYFKFIGGGSWHLLYQTLGIALSSTEMLLGIALLVGLRMRISCKIALLFISFFTVLTLFIAIFNPVSDCGCFGEALKLTNWQTFYKNVVFLFFAILLYNQREKFIPVAPPVWEWSFTGVYALMVLSLSAYSYRHLPMIDFMEFKVGTNIANKIDSETRKEGAVFETTLIYTKDGSRYEFSIENLPDSSYTFVDSYSKQISGGIAHMDFAISDRDGHYVTDSLLAIKSPLFIVSSPFLDRLSRRAAERINLLYDSLEHRDAAIILLSGSGWQVSDSAAARYNLKPEIFHSDFKTLLTFNRSNGGVVYMSEGSVIKKWSWRDIPLNELDGILKSDAELLSAKARIKEQLSAELTAILLLIIIGVMRFICKLLYIHKPEDEIEEGMRSISEDSVIHDI